MTQDHYIVTNPDDLQPRANKIAKGRNGKPQFLAILENDYLRTIPPIDVPGCTDSGIDMFFYGPKDSPVTTEILSREFEKWCEKQSTRSIGIKRIRPE
jgi:hypothetical protein